MSVKEHLQHIVGKKKGNIMLYTLSTCVWCKKTKRLLDDLNFDYRYVDVDLLSEADREQAIQEIRKWNPACSFPTLVVNNDRCIIGFKEDAIRELAADGG